MSHPTCTFANIGKSCVGAMQHCPPGRFLMLMGGAAVLYLTGLGPLQRALQRVVAMALPPPMRAPQAGQAGVAGQPNAAPQWSFLGELQAVIVGFFSSLIPGDMSRRIVPHHHTENVCPMLRRVNVVDICTRPYPFMQPLALIALSWAADMPDECD